MTERLRIPLVASAQESGHVLRVARVSLGDAGAFVVTEDGEEHLLPPELEKWAALAAALGTRGLVEFGQRLDLAGTREHGYYARVLEDEPVSARRSP